MKRRTGGPAGVMLHGGQLQSASKLAMGRRLTLTSSDALEVWQCQKAPKSLHALSGEIPTRKQRTCRQWKRSTRLEAVGRLVGSLMQASSAHAMLFQALHIAAPVLYSPSDRRWTRRGMTHNGAAKREKLQQWQRGGDGRWTDGHCTKYWMVSHKVEVKACERDAKRGAAAAAEASGGWCACCLAVDEVLARPPVQCSTA